MDLRIIYRITIFVLFFYHASSLGQQDTTITLETPTGISDSLITTDSTKTLKSQKKFFAQFEEEKNTDRKSTYSISKKEIDFTDYRYAGNIIDYRLRDTTIFLFSAINEKNSYTIILIH